MVNIAMFFKTGKRNNSYFALGENLVVDNIKESHPSIGFQIETYPDVS